MTCFYFFPKGVDFFIFVCYIVTVLGEIAQLTNCDT